MKRRELTPTDGRKSFYGKCYTMTDENGTETLYSYNTRIMTQDSAGNLRRVWDGWTATTGRHIKAFCGLNKAEYFNLPKA